MRAQVLSMNCNPCTRKLAPYRVANKDFSVYAGKSCTLLFPSQGFLYCAHNKYINSTKCTYHCGNKSRVESLSDNRPSSTWIRSQRVKISMPIDWNLGHCRFQNQRRLLSDPSSFKGTQFYLDYDFSIDRFLIHCILDSDSEWRDKYSKTSTAVAVLIRKRIIRILEILLDLWNQYSGCCSIFFIGFDSRVSSCFMLKLGGGGEAQK